MNLIAALWARCLSMPVFSDRDLPPVYPSMQIGKTKKTDKSNMLRTLQFNVSLRYEWS